MTVLCSSVVCAQLVHSSSVPSPVYLPCAQHSHVSFTSEDDSSCDEDMSQFCCGWRVDVVGRGLYILLKMVK